SVSLEPARVVVGELRRPESEDLRPHRELGDELPPCPRGVLEQQAGVVVGRPLQEDVAERLVLHLVAGVETWCCHGSHDRPPRGLTGVKWREWPRVQASRKRSSSSSSRG